MSLKDPKTQVLLAIILVAIISIWLFYTRVYVINSNKIQALEKEYRKIEADLNSAKAAVNRLPEVRRQYEITLKKWEEARELLPHTKEIPNLLKKVTNAGIESGVKFISFKPSPPISEGLYARIPVGVSVAGNYHQVGTFLSNVGNLPRIVNSTALTLLPYTDPRDKLRTVKADLTIITYIFQEGAEKKGGNQ